MDTRTIPRQMVEVRYRGRPEQTRTWHIPGDGDADDFIEALYRDLRHRHYFVTRWRDRPDLFVFEVT